MMFIKIVISVILLTALLLLGVVIGYNTGLNQKEPDEQQDLLKDIPGVHFPDNGNNENVPEEILPPNQDGIPGNVPEETFPPNQDGIPGNVPEETFPPNQDGDHEGESVEGQAKPPNNL
ncbi:hypothetical protein [Cytobacillus horneckiae]|uniref:hypothetical protein n=1 Tax=Cytobacillus horneckiae TaxID=549687 RepID=UPI003D9A8ACA